MVVLYYIMCYTYKYISPHYQWFELRVYSASIASTDWCESCYIRIYVCTTPDACACVWTTYCVSLCILLEYRPALSLVNATADFSERFCTFNYSYQESCSLYPRCTPYFSVEHTVSPQSAVSNSSSGCSVEYTIRNLMRCVSYQFTATALLGSQRGNPVVVGDTVMLSEWLQLTTPACNVGASRLDCMRGN